MYMWPKEDPFEDAQEALGSTVARHLASITYRCPLCRQVHTISVYITARTDATAPVLRESIQFFHSPNGQRYIADQAVTLHRERGDISEFPTAQVNDTRLHRRVRIKGIELDDSENEYTCDDCGQTFATIGELRIHVNRDPQTNVKNYPSARPACMPIP